MHSSHTKPALRSAADTTPFDMLAACSAIIGIGVRLGGSALEQMESNEALAKPSLESIDLPRASLVSSAFGLETIRPCSRAAARHLRRVFGIGFDAITLHTRS